ncbi:MAG: 2-hydroxy-3-oxopropionate reductase [Paenibacillus sp.]|jgi:3-hydroxyisobutyrate dehydrogenase-like beta-hydroxyacid dehydrogenase/uncharacterized protein YciI|nr:2-hydroxy-3-oxopropionate reductase [Paenibacillus sp.]
MKLAFIGLGNMGLPMSCNLLKAGHDVYGLNRSKAKERAFAAVGGRIGRSLPELAAEADVVMTCLPMPADVEEVYLGDEGVIAHGRPGLTLIDFSTVSPALNRRISEAAAARSMTYLDAPVSGGTVGARDGTLTVMVGGDEAAFVRVRPLLAAVGGRIHYVGPTGAGSIVKLLNQLMVGIHSQAVAETFRLAAQAGVGLAELYEILSGSFAQSRIMDRHYSQYIARDEYTAGFTLKLLHKDVDLAMQLAAERGARLPLGTEALCVLRLARETAWAEQDMAALYRVQAVREAGAGVPPAAGNRYYAALLPMRDEEKSRIHRSEHLAYLEEMRRAGRIFVNGRFVDGAGGLVIYKASSLEEARAMVENDPYVRHGARSCEIHEWDLVL